MGIERVRLWMWVLCGGLVGWLASEVYLSAKLPDLQTLSTAVADQSRFETYLMATDGKNPKMHDLMVHPYTLSEKGQRTRALIVTGVYYRSATDVPQPMHFIATGNYKPIIPLTRLGRAKGQELAKCYAALQQPTIVEYLNLIGEARGFSVAYAWWEEPRRIRAVGIGGGVVIIGLLWPIIINLLVYHRLLRPRETPATSLIGVAGTSNGPPPKIDVAPIDELNKELEERLAEAASEADSPAPAVAAAAPSAPKPLDLTPIAAAPVEQDRETEFGAKADDFYPTERHAPPGMGR